MLATDTQVVEGSPSLNRVFFQVKTKRNPDVVKMVFLHRHRKQTSGRLPKRKRSGMDTLGVWTQQIHTTIYKTVSSEDPL